MSVLEEAVQILGRTVNVTLRSSIQAGEPEVETDPTRGSCPPVSTSDLRSDGPALFGPPVAGLT